MNDIEVPHLCPVRKSTTRIESLSKDMLVSIVKLKHDLKACRTCFCEFNCPVLKSFNSQVSEAIQAICEEMNLFID